MHAVIPLLFVFILFNGKQLREDNMYRVSVLSLVGLSYFVFLQYGLYYNRVFPPPDGYAHYVPPLAIVLGVVALCFSPWIKRTSLWKACALLFLFLTGTAATYVFDVEIKNSIAEMGGYFDSGIPLLNDLEHDVKSNREVSLPGIAHAAAVPDTWTVDEMPSGHNFFTLNAEDQTLAEIRPNCISDSHVDLPTLVENALFAVGAQGQKQEVVCDKKSSRRRCLVKVFSDSGSRPIERWSWFSIGKIGTLGTTVDVLFYSPEPSLRKQTALILETLKPTDAASAVRCLGLAAWM